MLTHNVHTYICYPRVK